MNMNLNQALRQFVLFSAISAAVAIGTNAAKAADTAQLTVTSSGSGRGTFSPNYNGKFLIIDKNYTIRAIAAAGCSFSNWITAVGPTNTATNLTAKLTFQMVSNLQLTANFVDVKPPTVTITTRKSMGSNSVVAINGTAKDNVGVTAVWWQVGSNGWNLASTDNGYTNWTAFVILSAGTNIIEVYAEDAAGNRSLTNSVKLDDIPAGFAPESIAGTMLELVTTNNQSALLSFASSSFSQVSTNGASTGVGTYAYGLSDANTALLAATFTAPPATVSNNSGEAFTLSFTNGTSGTWTNTDTNSGTFTLSDASSTAPDSLSGLTLTGTNTGTNSVYHFTNEYGDDAFTSSNTDGSSSGTYTFAQYSPETGLLQESLTDEADAGTTNYIVLSFLTDSSTFYIESDTTNGTDTNAGTFGVAGETSTAGYKAPESLSGLMGAATEIHTNGMRRSFMISFGPSTFGQFTSGTNGDGGVGTYTFARTGMKTALFLNTYAAPPDQVGNNGTTPIPFTFVNSHSASFSNSESHGTITFSAPAATVPLSLVGKTLSGSAKGHAGGYSFGYGTFHGIAHDSDEAGTYTYSIYGPQAAMVVASEAGATNYLELWFSTAAGGSYREDNGSGKISTGAFTMH